MKRVENDQSGYTLVELVTGLVIFGIIALSFLYLFTSLVASTVVSKRKAEALSLATNQMEFLRSLPYNSLAVAGGAIAAQNPIPATKTEVVNNVKYTISTNIEYADDAFDGCGSYPSQELKEDYCRNFPAPSSAPATDTNPADYKLAHVIVTDPNGTKYADVDTQISARVAETASTTGAFIVNVIDSNGNPVQGANVQVTNSTVVPVIDVSNTTDSNGIVIFYGLTVDTNGFDYIATATKNGYSSLSTIAPAGSLQPNYPNQQVFTQLSSFVTLPIKLQGSDSLLIEATNTSGSALPNLKPYFKGGYKKFSDAGDTSYYFDNLSPDTRPVTDSAGIVELQNLVPGTYYACGDAGSTGCVVGGTTYYLAAALPYVGANSFNPITVPIYDPGSPPTTTFSHNGRNYLQKVRLMMTTSSTMPRIGSVSVYEVSLASGNPAALNFQITGQNLPCSSSASSCNTVVRLTQGANNYQASCTGSASAVQLDCVVDLSGVNAGKLGMSVTANGQTLQISEGPHIGAMNVVP